MHEDRGQLREECSRICLNTSQIIDRDRWRGNGDQETHDHDL